MKVFIIARGYPTKIQMDGIFEFDQAKALAQAGVEVVYIATVSGLFENGENGVIKALMRMEFMWK